MSEKALPTVNLAVAQEKLAEDILPPLSNALYDLQRSGHLEIGKIYAPDFGLLQVLPGIRHKNAQFTERFDTSLLSKLVDDHTVGYILMRSDGVVPHALGEYQLDQSTRALLDKLITEEVLQPVRTSVDIAPYQLLSFRR